MNERCCENCGNEFCANSVVAVWWDSCVDDNFTTHWKPRTYTPEQFARLCVSLGYIPKASTAEKYCNLVGKTVFTAIDFEDAARWYERNSGVRYGEDYTRQYRTDHGRMTKPFQKR